ncbi:MAG: HU family DNA-binding protein [Oscillospiraceae bacterium]|jgi:DNA-binding protein HU-beta|nr:HU family DNA-binding protein [Oscillospiraceae bacterium]
MELSAQVAAKAGLSKKDGEKVVIALFDTIVETLKKEERVQVVGFGTFETKTRPARKARNPRTGEPIDIAESKAVSFKPGKGLRDALAGEG